MRTNFWVVEKLIAKFYLKGDWWVEIECHGVGLGGRFVDTF
jgi:hypothetical protein